MCLKLDVKFPPVARKGSSTGQRHMFISQGRFLRRQNQWDPGLRQDGWLRAEGRVDAVDSNGFVFGIRKPRVLIQRLGRQKEIYLLKGGCRMASES